MYKSLVRPLAFQVPSELIHDVMLQAGYAISSLGLDELFYQLTKSQTSQVPLTIEGIPFRNRLGVGAGFDYKGTLAQLFSNLGFGFNTVGTVTYQYYEGNRKPRLGRLLKSEGLLVNKGFKSPGAAAVRKTLRGLKLSDKTVGVSIGSSNISSLDTIPKAIDDYIKSFQLFQSETYLKYFELNISCPNTALTENFLSVPNLAQLLREVRSLNVQIPIFIKMPLEYKTTTYEQLMDVCLKSSFRTFIFSNLLKDRSNPDLVASDITCYQGKEGNISGRPTRKLSTDLIRKVRSRYGKDINIIGCGGVFTRDDYLQKLEAGADLVQLVSGLVYEGPFIAKHILQE